MSSVNVCAPLSQDGHRSTVMTFDFTQEERVKVTLKMQVAAGIIMHGLINFPEENNNAGSLVCVSFPEQPK